MDSFSPLEQALADRDRALELLRGSEGRARRIIETSGDAFVSMGSDGVVEAWNGAAEVTFGWRADEAIGRPLHELIIPPEQRADHLRGLERMRAGEQASILGQTLELTALRRDGGELPVELTVWAIDDDDRRSFNAFVRDISARVAAQEALAASVERFRLTQLHAPIGMALVGLGGRWLQVNPALCLLVGRSEKDLLALTFGDITHPDDLAEDLGLVEQLLRGDIRSYELEKRYLRPDGQTVHVLLSVSLLYTDGEPQYFIVHILDIGARRRDEEALKVAAAELAALNCELSLLSTTDPLTGTFNRRHIDEVLSAACQTAQRHDDSVAVLLIDIDHFKQVNDHHGHRSGDDVLKIVTRRLASAVRTEDTLGRWGGEEFIAVLPRTDQAAAVALAERLRSCVADEPVPVGDDYALRITISIGVASATYPAPERLVADADRAMYSAKETGRNRVA